MKFLGLEIRRASDGVKKDTQLPVISRSAGSLLFYPNMSRAELMTNTTVSACVMLIADSIAQMTCNVYTMSSHCKLGNEQNDSQDLNLYSLRLHRKYNGEALKHDMRILQKPCNTIAM